jgi:hypothetical protein
MSDHDTAGSRSDATERLDRRSTERYEPPEIEDLETADGPSVTAAGVQVTVTKTAPRRL